MYIKAILVAMFLCIGILESGFITSSPTFKIFNFLRQIYGYGYKSSKV